MKWRGFTIRRAIDGSIIIEGTAYMRGYISQQYYFYSIREAKKLFREQYIS